MGIPWDETGINCSGMGMGQINMSRGQPWERDSVIEVWILKFSVIEQLPLFVKAFLYQSLNEFKTCQLRAHSFETTVSLPRPVRTDLNIIC